MKYAIKESDGTFQADLAECEKEPIHIPSKIQRFGFLLAVDTATLQIVQCSTNAIDFIGISHQDLLGQHLSNILEEQVVDKIQYSLTNEGINLAMLNPIKLGFKQLDTKFKGVLHFSEGILVIEVELSIYEEFSYSDFYNNVNIIIQRFNSQKDTISLCRVVAEEVKRIAGYDRVMIYKFDKDWNGEVIAESKEEKLDAFLGLHFPASDIPAQARQLYLTNLIRIITDVSYQATELIPILNPIKY